MDRVKKNKGRERTASIKKLINKLKSERKFKSGREIGVYEAFLCT